MEHEPQFTDPIENGKSINESLRRPLETVISADHSTSQETGVNEEAPKSEDQHAHVQESVAKVAPEVQVDSPEGEKTEEKPFKIEDYPKWREIWKNWPESAQAYFIPIIKSEKLSPEVYKMLELSVVESKHDRPMPERYNMGKKKVAAEALYYNGQAAYLRVYPELHRIAQERGSELGEKIVGHELGHMLNQFIDNEIYASMVKDRPEWANSRYIRDIAQKAPKQQLHEMLADDFSFYLRIKTADLDEMAAEMVENRLAHGLSEEERQQYTPEQHVEAYQALFEESKQLIAYFQTVLDPDYRQAHIDENFGAAWLAKDGLDDWDGFQAHEIPADVGYPTSPQSKEKRAGLIERLIYAGGTKESVKNVS